MCIHLHSVIVNNSNLILVNTKTITKPNNIGNINFQVIFIINTCDVV